MTHRWSSCKDKGRFSPLRIYCKLRVNMMSKTLSGVYDAVVIGGSCAGLTAALNLGRTHRKVVVLDGGVPRNAPAAEMHGFFSRDGENPLQVRQIAIDQMLRYPAVSLLQDQAESIEGEIDRFVVKTTSSRILSARRIILATGYVLDDFPLPIMSKLWGKSVIPCPYCHGYEISNKKVGIWVGDAHAADLAMMLREWSPDVTAFSNGIDLQLQPQQLENLKLNVASVETTPIADLVVDEQEQLTGVKLSDGRLIECDSLFYRPVVSLPPIVRSLDLKLGENPMCKGLVQVGLFGDTSREGIFAAGDVTMTGQVATAVSSGALAGIACHRSLAQADMEVAKL